MLDAKDDSDRLVGDLMIKSVAVAFPDETLGSVADRMAQYGFEVLPVMERRRPDRVEGLVSQFDLLAARQRLLEEERHAERVLVLHRVPRRSEGAAAAPAPSELSAAEAEPTAGPGVDPMGAGGAEEGDNGPSQP